MPLIAGANRGQIQFFALETVIKVDNEVRAIDALANVVSMEELGYAWKIYKEAFNIEIGKLEKFGDFDLSNRTVQRKVKERYGNEIPKDELVITPDRMFKSEKLITIKEK